MPVSNRTTPTALASDSVDRLVFPSPTTGRAFTNEAFPKLLRELGIEGSAHGMRSSLRSWAAETGVPREVAELSLGHAIKGVEGAYQRSDLLEQRRDVMHRWGGYLCGEVA